MARNNIQEEFFMVTGKPKPAPASWKERCRHPIIRVDITTGRVLVQGIRDFWERQRIESIYLNGKY